MGNEPDTGTAAVDVESGPTEKPTQGVALDEVIKSEVAGNPVVLYGKSHCPFCVQAEEVIRKYSVPCKTIWVDKVPEDYHTSLKRLYNQKTVPYVFINGEFIGGCDDTKALENSGELNKKLRNVTRSETNGSAVESAVSGPTPKPLRPLFYFPDLVDSWTVRVVALQAACISIASIPLRFHLGMHFAVLGLLIDFCIRFVAGPGPSPLANIAKVVVSIVRYNKPPDLVQGWPKQFATFVGICCCMLGTIFYFIPLDGTKIFAAVIMAMLAFFALLEALFNFCAGCFVFSLAVRFGIVPKTVYAVGTDAKPEMLYMWAYANESKRLSKPEVKRQQCRTQPTSIDFKWKLEDQEDHERFDYSVIRHTKITHFQMCLGLMALAAVWKLAAMPGFGYDISSTVWKVLLGVAFVVYVVFTALYALRCIMYPRKLWKEWMCPVKSNSFAVWFITLELLAFLVVDLWGAGRTIGKVLFWIGAPSQLLLAYIRFSMWVSDKTHEEAVNAAWLMAPVGGFVATIVGVYLDPVNYTEAMYLWFSFSLLMWVVLLTITFQKAVLSHNSDERFRPMMWTWVAAPAAAAVAWAALSAAEDGSTLFFLAAPPFSKLLFFMALGLALSLAFGFVRGFFGRSRFDMMADWGYVFPLCALSMAFIVYEGAVNGSFTMGLVYTSLGVASWVACFLSLHTIHALINGGIFKPDQKWGPLSIMRLTHEAFRGFVPKLQSAVSGMSSSTKMGHTVDEFLGLWHQFETVHTAHSRHEDEVIFKTFDEYFPGVASARTAEHAQHHEKFAEWHDLAKELRGCKDDERKEAIIEQLQLEIPPFLQDMLVHLKEEEMHLQPIGRKILPIALHEKLLRKIFDITPIQEWYVFMPWLINNAPMLPQRVRFVRCFTWVVPERAELIGRMISQGVDKTMWARLIEHVPEIIPRGEAGWKRYY